MVGPLTSRCPTVPGGHRDAVVVHQPRLESRDHLPGGAAAGLAGTVGDEVVQRLGRAHHLDQLEAEAIGPRLEQRGGQRLARRHAVAQRREVPAALGLGHLQHARPQRGHGQEDRRSLGGDRLEGALGGDPLGLKDGGGAHPGGKVETVAEAEREEHLRRREDEIVGTEAEDADAHEIGGGHEVRVRVDRRLRPARGARGVAPVRDVLGQRRGGLDHRRGARERFVPRQGARRAAVGHQHGPQPRTAVADGGQAERDVARDDRDARPAVVQQERVVLGRHQRVHRHADRAQPGHAPERRREGRRIVQRQQDPLLDLHAELGQGPRRPRRLLGDLPVGDRASPEAERRPSTVPGGQVTIDEERRDVEGRGDRLHRRHTTPRRRGETPQPL